MGNNRKQQRKQRKPVSPFTSGTRLWLAVILIVTAIAFYPSLNNGFTNWDDNLYVTQNDIIKDLSWNSVKTFFTTYYGGNYHPLVALTNAIEYHFWQLNPKPYHVINLLLHLANTGLVFWFIHLLSGRRTVAIIVSLFFGIHPMHVESVAWIAERKDVLYTFFYLGSLIAYLRYLKDPARKEHLVYVGLLLLLSLFSKSAAVIAPATYLLIDFYKKRSWNLSLLVEKAPFFLLSLIFGIVALQSQASAKALNTLEPFSIIDRVLISSYAVVFYIGKLFWPLQLSAFYNFPLIGPALPLKYYLAPVFIALIIFVVLKNRSMQNELLFGLSFYLFNIILVIQIISVGMAVVAERYTYVSYIGLLFIVAHAFSLLMEGHWKLPGSFRIIAKGIVIAFAMLCAVLTWERCKVWYDGETLFTDALKYERTSPIPYYNRAMARYHKGEYRTAIEDFDKAIALYAKDVDYFLNRGASKFALQDFRGALADFEKILRLDPKNADGLVNAANAEAMLDNYGTALEYFNRALTLDPTEPLGYYNRGQLHYRMKDLDKACADWQRSFELGFTDATLMIQRYCRN